MDRKQIKDAMFPECPVRNVLSRIMDKWTLLVLYTLESTGTMRFNDTHRAILDISQKMLTTTLKSMVHGEVGPPEPAAVPGRAGPLLEEVPGVQGLRNVFQPQGPSVDAVPL